jgi:hypothetical protein
MQDLISTVVTMDESHLDIVYLEAADRVTASTNAAREASLTIINLLR